MYRDVVQWSKIRHRILVKATRVARLPARLASARIPSTRCLPIATRSHMGQEAIDIQG